MSVGFPQGKSDIDNRAGQLAVTLRDTLLDGSKLNALLVGQTDAQLLALGWVQAEVTALRTALNVIDQLRQVYQGLLAIPSPVNISSFVTPLVGTN